MKRLPGSDLLVLLAVPAAVIVALSIQASRFGLPFYLSLAILVLALIIADRWLVAGTILAFAAIRSVIWFALTGSKFALATLAITGSLLWLLLKNQPRNWGNR